MQNIIIGRFASDPEAQGCVKAEDGSWQVVIDKDGLPHFWIRVHVEGGETGMLCLDHMLPAPVPELMTEGEFGGELTGPELEAAVREYESQPQPPCPR